MENDYIKRKHVYDLAKEYLNYTGLVSEGYEILLKKIAEIPAEEVQPIIHGQWVRYGIFYDTWKAEEYQIFQCSHCETDTLFKTDENLYGICPHCGATMGI